MDNTVYTAVAVAVSFFIAILSGLGVGSGGLFVIWLTAIYGVSATQARGMNLLFFVFSATAAFFFHLKRRKLDLNIIAKAALFTAIGTLLGTQVGSFLESGLLRRIFGGFLVLSGVYSLFARRTRRKSEQ